MKREIKNYVKWIRPSVQIFFFLLILSTVISKSLSEIGIKVSIIPEASLHALCPFGGVVSLYNLIVAGTLVQKIHASSVILMYVVLLSAILFGPVFCGWICPFGTFQEFLGKIGRKIFGRRYNNLIPKKIDRILRYLRYIIMTLVIYNTAVTAKLLFQNFDPYYALFNFFTNEVAITAYITLGITVLLSLIIERPFCKYACPFGAVLGVTNLFRIFKIRRQKDTCINCKLCDRDCPMNIEISNKAKIYDHQCISCMKCTSESACPVDKTVEFSTRIKNIRISVLLIGVIIVGMIMGTIGVTSALGMWKTTNTKIPATYKDGEFKGEYDPSDIRGSYTFYEISEVFKISLTDLGDAFALGNPDNYGDFACKELEAIYAQSKESGKEVGTTSVKIFVALYKGLPIELDDNTYFPNTVKDVLFEKSSLTEEQKNYISGHLVGAIIADTESAAESEKSGESTNFVKGKTTFKEILVLGVKLQDIEDLLGLKVEDTSEVIKDFCSENGLEFSIIKEGIQSLIDKK